jgi:RNA polymerase sigma-70 factor, ECF subfamily
MPDTAAVLLIDEIRAGRPEAWARLIAEYEGRLLAFVESRLRNRAAAEDVVQDTFIGFLTSLPNYDPRRPLESWLFSIAAHKLTDSLRREGRRPALPLSSGKGSDAADHQIAGADRPASSIARSGERRDLEAQALAIALCEQFDKWRTAGDWQKIKCMELLFVRGAANKEVAMLLGITEQQVANFKFDFLERLKSQLRRQSLCAEVFPELVDG